MLTRIIFLTAFTLFTLPSFSSATKITREPIDELLKQADYVALVQVYRGETLWVGDQLCGVKYQARVLDGIKGSFVGELTEWNTAAGYANSNLEVGTRYLIFLTKPEKRYDPVGSTNAYSERRRAMFEKTCGAVLQGNRVVHSGNGALKIETPMSGRSSIVAAEWDDIVRIPSGVIQLPDSLKTKRVEEKGQECFLYKDVWVQLKDLLFYLKSVVQ